MSEYSFNVKVDPPVDLALSREFSEMLTQLQRSMCKIASEHNRIREGSDELSAENHKLRMDTNKLQIENGQLKQELAAYKESWKASKMGPSTQEQKVPGFQLQRTIKIHTGPVHSVTMGSSNDTMATASWDGTVKIYNLVTDEVVQTLGKYETGGRMMGLYSVAFAKTSPEVLGCTSVDKAVYLWNHQTGKLLRRLTGHDDEVNGIDFHSSQQVMCTASDDTKVIIWDFQEGFVLRTLDKHTKQVYGATFLGEDHQYLVATCCFDQKVRVFDMRDRQVVKVLSVHTDDIIGIDYTSNGQFLATGSDDGQIALWDTRNWKQMQVINTWAATGRGGGGAVSDNEVKRVAISPSGRLLAAGCSSGRVLVYDVTTNPAHQAASLGGHTDCCFDVTWGISATSNTAMLVSASHDNTCQYWQVGLEA